MELLNITAYNTQYAGILYEHFIHITSKVAAAFILFTWL